MGVQMEPYPELSDSFSRDCLESRRRVLDRLCVVLQEDEMGHFRPLLATRYTPNRGLLELSRQSLEGVFSEVHAELSLVASCLLWIGTTCQTSGSERRTASERS